VIITSAASDQMKHQLEKAKRKGRVPEDAKIAMRVQILQEDGKPKFSMGIEYDDFIQETDDIIVLNGIRVIVDKESGKLLEESTLDFCNDERGVGFGVDRIGPKEKLPGEP
jgi:Fe-S cluster assembly iron-binding protein IscA